MCEIYFSRNEGVYQIKSNGLFQLRAPRRAGNQRRKSSMQMHLAKAQYLYFKSMPILVNIIKVEMNRISTKTRQEMFITQKVNMI